MRRFVPMITDDQLYIPKSMWVDQVGVITQYVSYLGIDILVWIKVIQCLILCDLDTM